MQEALEIDAVEEFRDDAERTVVGPGLVEDAHGGRAGQDGQRVGFSKYPVAPRTIVGHGLEDLDGDFVALPKIDTPVDGPLTTAAERVHKPISVADDLSLAVRHGGSMPQRRRVAPSCGVTAPIHSGRAWPAITIAPVCTRIAITG